MLFIILHEVLPMAHLLSGKTVVSLAAPVSVNRSKKINDVAHDHLTNQDTQSKSIQQSSLHALDSSCMFLWCGFRGNLTNFICSPNQSLLVFVCDAFWVYRLSERLCPSCPASYRAGEPPLQFPTHCWRHAQVDLAQDSVPSSGKHHLQGWRGECSTPSNLSWLLSSGGRQGL